MARKHYVYLVPGFFGFTNLGNLPYFLHVREFLQATLTRLGMRAELVYVPTSPTASLRRRALRLHEAVRATAGRLGAPIDIIGHSTGGLDARLFVTPHAALGEGVDVERLARRVRTVVTVSTPHYGTPLASFFASRLGQPLLRLLSLVTVYTLRFGYLPINVALSLVGVLVRLDEHVGLSAGVSDQLYAQLLGDFSEERRDEISRFLAQVTADQSLIPQLTPEGLDVFNASVTNREGTRYGSVVSWAPAPGLRTILSAGADPYAQATHALYQFLHRWTRGLPRERAPLLTRPQTEVLLKAFGEIPASDAADGVVPTLSQVWGELVHAARADHLDVIGHFDDRQHDPPHFDWLATGSGFNRRRFEALWTDVARYLANGG